MGVTLTGKTIKDTYKGLLKFEDNLAVGTTAKRVTDGFGNDVGIKLGNDEVLMTKPYTAMTKSSINADANGKVLVSKEWVEDNTGPYIYTSSIAFYGNGVLDTFVLTNPFGYSNVMLQVYNNVTGVYLALGVDYEMTRAYTQGGSPEHSITIETTVPLANNTRHDLMIAKIYGPVF